ncbi:MAG: hypothetical protein ACTSUE_07990 [Promethearchaeota archaeon]
MVIQSEKNCETLTKYNLWRLESTTRDGNIPIPEDLIEIESGEYKYILGIFASAKQFFKVTSYFLKTPIVTKLTVIFKDLSVDMVKDASLIIKNFKNPPIHVSGFCKRYEKYIYEAYLRGDRKEDVDELTSHLEKKNYKFEIITNIITLKNNDL